jgi:hypothetical protein
MEIEEGLKKNRKIATKTFASLKKARDTCIRTQNNYINIVFSIPGIKKPEKNLFPVKKRKKIMLFEARLPLASRPSFHALS